MKLTWAPRKTDYQEETNWKKLLSDSGVATLALSETEHFPLVLEVDSWEVEVVYWSSKYIFGSIKVPTINNQTIVIDKWNQNIKEETNHFSMDFVFDKALMKFFYTYDAPEKITKRQDRAFSRNLKVTEKKILEREKFLSVAKKEKPFND